MIVTTRHALSLASSLTLLALTGCDAAEQSAQKLIDETVEKTTEAARDAVNQAIGDAVDQLNEQVDTVQRDVDDVLGKQAEGDDAAEQATDDSVESGEKQG